MTIELPEGMTIPSVNKHKEVGRGGKHMFKNPRVRKYQEEIKEQLKGSCLENVSSPDSPVLRVGFKFYFKNRYWRRDVTNMIKATEDGLKDVLGIDDGRTVYITAEKIRTSEKIEKVEIKVEVFDEDSV